MALRILSFLLLAGAAEAAISGGSILSRTSSEVVLELVNDGTAISPGPLTFTSLTAKFSATTGAAITGAVTIKSLATSGGAYQSETVAATVTDDATTVTIVFNNALVIPASTNFLVRLPFVYVSDGDITEQGNTFSYLAANECTCGNGGAAGFDLSVTMSCAFAVSNATNVKLTIVDDAYLTAFDATNLDGGAVTEQIDGVDAATTAYAKAAANPFATITMTPATSTTIAADANFTMTAVPTSAYNDATDDFSITCDAIAYCQAGNNGHSVGTVSFCATSSAQRMAGASILAVLMAGVSMLV